MLILFYTAVSLCFFLFWADRSKFRRYYSSLLFISYMRFLEQYVLVYVFKVWKYQDLPTPLAKIIDVPILLDITLYPMLAYLMVHYSHAHSSGTIKRYLIWAGVMTTVELTMILTGMLVHQQYWNFGFSYALAIVTVILLHLQYKLHLRTGWYQT